MHGVYISNSKFYFLKFIIDYIVYHKIINEINAEIFGHILESESDFSSDEQDFDEIVPEPPVLTINLEKA